MFGNETIDGNDPVRDILSAHSELDESTSVGFRLMFPLRFHIIHFLNLHCVHSIPYYEIYQSTDDTHGYLGGFLMDPLGCDVLANFCACFVEICLGNMHLIACLSLNN